MRMAMAGPQSVQNAVGPARLIPSAKIRRGSRFLLDRFRESQSAVALIGDREARRCFVIAKTEVWATADELDLWAAATGALGNGAGDCLHGKPSIHSWPESTERHTYHRDRPGTERKRIAVATFRARC